MAAPTAAENGATLTCGKCALVLPLSAFTPGSVKGRKYCRACIHAKNARYFSLNRHVYISNELKRDGMVVDSSVVLAVIERFEHKCFVTGEKRAQLTLIAVDPTKPLDVDNLVPVSRHLRRLLHGRFPSHLLPQFRVRGSTPAQPTPAAPNTAVETMSN